MILEVNKEGKKHSEAYSRYCKIVYQSSDERKTLTALDRVNEK